MKIQVKAKTKAKVAGVERLDQANLGLGNKKAEMPSYAVSVKEAPVQGKANEAIIKALADYFDTAPSRIRLVSGQSSKKKIFEIN